MLPWSALTDPGPGPCCGQPTLFTVERPTASRSPYGEAINTFNVVQIVQGTMQPYMSRTGRGILTAEQEGEAQRLTYRLFCNFVNRDVPEPTPTDIQFLDRIVDAEGNYYRVMSAEDDGGFGDHLLVEVVALSPTGD